MTSTIAMNDPFFEDLNADTLPPEAILLTPSQIQQAIQQSQRRSDPVQRWQAYLSALAQIGFQQWLQERSPVLTAKIQPQPLPDDLVPDDLATHSVSTLQVGGYTLCLIAIGSLTDDRITVPTIDSPHAMPHLYVLVEVWEEQDCVTVYGHLRRDQLLHQQRTLSLPTDAAAWLSLDWFDTNVDTLLLYLRCLDPEAIISVTGQEAEGKRQKVEGRGQEAEGRRETQFSVHPSGTLSANSPQSSSPSPAINVGAWLRDRLDEVAQELSWVLLPPLAVTFRDTATPAEQFDTVTMELLQRGIAIPPHARGAYRNLAEENVALRLYAITWQESQTTEVPEWSLLLILGAQPGHELPVGTALQVEDNLQILDRQILRERQPGAYLFTRVIGAWNEQFQVTIDLTHGAVIHLPPFRFQPNV